MTDGIVSCDRENIHVPGSIQPHGVLLVVDSASDRIIQAAGPFNDLLSFDGMVIGKVFRDIVGTRASSFTEYESKGRTAARLPRGDSQLIATAHRQENLVVVEFERAAPSRSSEALFDILSRASRHFSVADNVRDACRLAANAVREISGYDRVLAYRFASDWSGMVIGEDRNDTFPTLVNHHFPETDIPQQARALYLHNPIRVIPDATYIPAVLLPPLTLTPLDMTNCLLRSVSPIHLQYLKNMGVGGSMSVSVIVDGALWGLLAAHSQQARHVSAESRELCRLVGWMLSSRIEVLEQKRRLQESQNLTARREELLFALRRGSNPEAQLGAMLPTLRELVRSDGVAIVCASSIQTSGLVPREENISELVLWLATKTDQTRAFNTDSLSSHMPTALKYFRQASGLLSVFIPNDPPICLIWFRAEQILELEWAGNPHAKASAGVSALNPRKSFDVWRQQVRRRSSKWTAAETETVELFATRATGILQAHAIRNLNAVLRTMNAELSVEASTDPLTGLSNRRALDKYLREQWELAKMHHRKLSLVMCDVDVFKAYNDRFGHPAGDACLEEVARIIANQQRPSDMAARVGGEEFCLLLTNMAADDALKLAETIRVQVQGLAIENPDSPFKYVTISLGVATNDCVDIRSKQDLIDVADAALYEAKRSGRNRVVGGTGSSLRSKGRSPLSGKDAAQKGN